MKVGKTRVAWDSSHGEFLINDYYYFSKLKKYAESEEIIIGQVDDFDKLWDYDVVVFNYPEIEFSRDEVERIVEMSRSKKVIFLSYYSNVDGVSRNVNKIVENFGLNLENSVIVDEKDNIGDPMFPVATWGEKEVVMPCSAPVRGGVAIVSGKDIFAAKSGNVAVFGTCVFWDNYSIDLKANRELALSILKGNF